MNEFFFTTRSGGKVKVKVTLEDGRTLTGVLTELETYRPGYYVVPREDAWEAQGNLKKRANYYPYLGETTTITSANKTARVVTVNSVELHLKHNDVILWVP